MAYIDKSRAIGMLERFREEHSNLPNACLKMIDVALNIIKQIPTADVVEVARCENCKHGEISIISKTKDGEETVACYCNAKNKVTNLEYFCACGERRDT